MKYTLLELLRGGEIDSARTIVKWRLLLWCGGVFAALLQTWAFRHDVSPDGISYLDIANQCARGNWHSLINGYWSPLYPFLLSLGFRVLRPSPYWESTVAHFVNFGIFVLSFVCFEVFLKALIHNQRRYNPNTDGDAIPEWALWVLGDSLFVWATLLLIHLQRLQPDLCVAALVYFAAAEVLRIWSGKSNWFGYARFGGILGIAYLAKAVMFPLAFVFLGCALFAAKPIRQTIPRATLALAVFILVGTPFITALYKQKGRVTYGDVGTIAYAEFVNGARRYIHWQGGPPGTGMPVHATRMLRAEPPVFEFGTPIHGTYPPWYDPSYWYEGVSNKFILRNQLSAVHYTIEEYVGILPYMAGIVCRFSRDGTVRAGARLSMEEAGLVLANMGARSSSLRDLRPGLCRSSLRSAVFCLNLDGPFCWFTFPAVPNSESSRSIARTRHSPYVVCRYCVVDGTCALSHAPAEAFRELGGRPRSAKIGYPSWRGSRFDR